MREAAYESARPREEEPPAFGNHIISALLSIAVLCGTLTAGLWPFHAPTNAVTWLPGSNGLRFGDSGTLVSAGEVRLAAPSVSGCSREVGAQRARRSGSSTLLA